VNQETRVLIVDIPDRVDDVAQLLSADAGIQVVGTAQDPTEILRKVHDTSADIVLLDIDMSNIDAIHITEQLTREFPAVGTILMSFQADPDYLRRSMLAGARGLLVRPFAAHELAESIRNVRIRLDGRPPVAVGPGLAQPTRDGKIIAVFSPKGGVGRTTLAVNAAVAAAQMGKRVALVDADLQFGDVAVFLDLDPRKRSIADLVGAVGDAAEVVEGATVTHRSGVRTLLAPATPDAAELITPDHARWMLGALRQSSDAVFVDCSTYLNETTLSVLDMADEIMVVMSLELTSIRGARQFIDLSQHLGYADKLSFTLNRADANPSISVADLERSLERKVDYVVASDGRAAVHALNVGVPFVAGNPKAHVSMDVVALTKALLGHEAEQQQPVETERAPRGMGRLALARR
jgi:pilus assembly protein CpaE